MEKVLVVDDHGALRRLMCLGLSESYEIIDSGEPEQVWPLPLSTDSTPFCSICACPIIPVMSCFRRSGRSATVRKFQSLSSVVKRGDKRNSIARTLALRAASISPSISIGYLPEHSRRDLANHRQESAAACHASAKFSKQRFDSQAGACWRATLPQLVR